MSRKHAIAKQARDYVVVQYADRKDRYGAQRALLWLIAEGDSDINPSAITRRAARYHLNQIRLGKVP